MLAYVLSKADNWKIRLGDLRRQGNTGRDVARRILRELETTGYLTRERVRIAHGQFDWICTVYEQPQTTKKARNSPCPEKPSTAEPPVAEPSTAERSTVNQPIYKQETLQKEKLKEKLKILREEREAHTEMRLRRVCVLLTLSIKTRKSR